MIFISENLEKIVQVKDKTRLDFRRTFASQATQAEIDSMTVYPDILSSGIDITEDKYLDWVYDVSGEKTIRVDVVDTDSNIFSENFTIKILTDAEDNLFSNDSDINSYEPDLFKWVQEGRDSFLDKHRTAQSEILEELNNAGYEKSNGSRYEAKDIVNIKEFQALSKYTTLRIIFEGISNDIDDVFAEKARRYNSLAVNTKKRAYYRLTPDQNVGEVKRDVFSGYLVRE